MNILAVIAVTAVLIALFYFFAPHAFISLI
jgi:hypothetical protein